MSEPVKVNFKIYQGSTFTRVLRWELPTIVYKTISAVYLEAPLRVQAVAHGIPTGWRCKLADIGGTKELNTDDYLYVTSSITDVVTFNAINAKGYTAYTSGGTLYYNEHKNLAGLTARMQIREKVSSTTTLLELTTENGGIVIDNVAKTITINITATQTTALSFKSAVYSLEVIDGTTVIPFIYGSITLDVEITR